MKRVRVRPSGLGCSWVKGVRAQAACQGSLGNKFFLSY